MDLTFAPWTKGKGRHFFLWEVPSLSIAAVCKEAQTDPVLWGPERPRPAWDPGDCSPWASCPHSLGPAFKQPLGLGWASGPHRSRLTTFPSQDATPRPVRGIWPLVSFCQGSRKGHVQVTAKQPGHGSVSPAVSVCVQVGTCRGQRGLWKNKALPSPQTPQDRALSDQRPQGPQPGR